MTMEMGDGTGKVRQPGDEKRETSKVMAGRDDQSAGMAPKSGRACRMETKRSFFEP